MELRCLLGHEFGEREVERERREAGDEVVVVYRTVENCRRCGTRRVVSENKEVRSIGAVAGEDGAPPSGDATEREAGTGAEGEVEEAADEAGPLADHADAGRALAEDATEDASAGAGDGAEPARPGSLIEAAEAVGAAGTGADADGTTDDADGTTDDADGTTDDAVIIGGDGSDEDDGTGGDPGADPATDAVAEAETESPGADAGNGAELLGGTGDAGNGVDEAADRAGNGAAAAAATADDGWPEPSPDAEDEGYDASPHEDTATGVDFGGGFAPTAEGTGADAGAGVEPSFVRAEGRSVAARDADGPTELCCPNCGATRTAAGSSLRGGDICPECRKGYVAERAREE